MGKALIESIANHPQACLTAALCRQNSAFSLPAVSSLSFIGHEIAPGVCLTSDMDETLKKPDVLIDFTHPDALSAHIQIALKHSIPLLVGTTGLSPQALDTLHEASQHIPLLQAPNTSIGITVLSILAEHAAALLPEHFDVEICEMHHREKKDAPSGTAIALGAAIAQGKKKPFTAPSDATSRTASRHPDLDIGYAVMRGGGVVGDHHVHFLGDQESLTLSHRSFSRHLFADGALYASLWLATQSPGFYTMKHALSHALENIFSPLPKYEESMWL